GLLDLDDESAPVRTVRERFAMHFPGRLPRTPEGQHIPVFLLLARPRAGQSLPESQVHPCDLARRRQRPALFLPPLQAAIQLRHLPIIEPLTRTFQSLIHIMTQEMQGVRIQPPTTRNDLRRQTDRTRRARSRPAKRR